MKDQTSHLPPHILVVDSGVGGLSIVEAILQKIPQAHLTFCSDSAAYPYGTKEEAVVLQRVTDLVRCLVDDVHPDLVVIACNTASTIALPTLRESIEVPVVGVVPAIKTAAEISKTRHIGLLATPATVGRIYTDNLIKEFAGGCLVVKSGSSVLVDMAEQLILGHEPDLDQAKYELNAFFADDEVCVDTIVLGCTHFPLLLPYLQKAAPRAVQWIDSGAAIARRSEFLLTELGFNLLTHLDKYERRAIVTGDLSENPLMNSLRERGFEVSQKSIPCQQ